MFIALSILTALWIGWTLFFAYEATKNTFESFIAASVAALSLLLGSMVFGVLWVVWWYTH